MESYNRSSAVVLGGLEGSVERGEPVDSATKGEVVKSSGHFVSRSDGLAELGSRVSQVESAEERRCGRSRSRLGRWVLMLTFFSLRGCGK